MEADQVVQICEDASPNATTCATYARVLVDYYYDEVLKEVFTDVASMMINSDAMDVMIISLDNLFVMDTNPNSIKL